VLLSGHGCVELAQLDIMMMHRRLRKSSLNGRIVVDRRTSIVLATPSEIPATGDKNKGYEYYGSIVHGCGCDGEVRGHAEEGDG